AQSSSRDLDPGEVAYRIFPRPDGAHSLSELRRRCFSVAGAVSAGHAWHERPFNLCPADVTDRGTVDFGHLHGLVRVGDCVHDEWMIVRILLAVTKQLSEVVLAADIVDEDGQFLLAETADYLPDWLEPETSDNRAWLMAGRLHLLTWRDGGSGGVELSKALRLLAASDSVECLTDAAQSCLTRRAAALLDEQPAVHRARVFLPASLAAALAVRPDLVGPVAAAFCQRDAKEARRCRRRCSLLTAGDRLTLCTPLLNRCRYAQLMSQAEAGYAADRRSDWAAAEDSMAAKAPMTTQEVSEHRRAMQLGLMLTHGAEILLDKCPAGADPDDGADDDDFDDLEASSRLLSRLCRSAPPVPDSVECPDSDDWLTVTPDQLDELMARVSGRCPVDLADLAEDGAAGTFAEFLRAESGLDGVESAKSTNSKSTTKATDFESTKLSNKIDIDAEGLVASLNKIFDQFVDSDDDNEDAETDEAEDEDSDDVDEETVSDGEGADGEANESADAARRQRILMRRYMRQMDAELSGTAARGGGGGGGGGASLEAAYAAEQTVRPGPLSGLFSAAGIAPRTPRRP
ncbi:hypothetical protein BOX15_Mlig000833g6, partial [Macrostomum lignano]